MKTKNNNGNWFLEKEDDYYYINNEKCDNIALVDNERYCTHDNLALAKIMLSAPELLEALEDLVKYLKHIEPNSMCELELAEKAIAKAKGN